MKKYIKPIVVDNIFEHSLFPLAAATAAVSGLSVGTAFTAGAAMGLMAGGSSRDIYTPAITGINYKNNFRF